MRDEEIKNLKVGDTVCDCNYDHQEVVEIEEVWLPHHSLGRYLGWLPFGLQVLLEKVWPTSLADKDVRLKNGRRCSAQACCHPAPHPDWEHPPIEK